MSLQGFWALYVASPDWALNVLALFFAGAGAWLWLATRWRELRSIRQLAPVAGSMPVDTRTQQLNRFFYRFGLACLSSSVLLSWCSTQV